MKENKNFLVLKDIKKTYDDGYVACSNINISIDKGKFVTILGPSGCGKTTLLKMIAGFEKPTNGKIIVNGIDIKDLPIHKRNTATVFQDYALFPNMTVYQNIAYGVKLLRKNLNHIPKRYTALLEKTRNEALAKATHQIQNLKDDQLKIDIEINR
ncbi:ABC transporter ATP-binding protein [bacterium]|nr:ABC transporter ATP-binding protein [bacterium]